ncbi:hypothetical protein IscW_ISCW014171, partial [Ixodes scapularis]
QTIQFQTLTPEPTSNLPHTAEWVRRSPPPESLAHQPSEYAIRWSPLRPATLPHPDRDPATGASSWTVASTPPPSRTPQNTNTADASRYSPSTTCSPFPFPSHITHSCPFPRSSHYQQRIDKKFAFIVERSAPCDQQFAELANAYDEP